MLTRDISGEMSLSYLCPLHGPASRSLRAVRIVQHSSIVASCSDAEVRGGAGIFSHMREALVVEVVSFGERGVKQGEMPIANWHTGLNEIMARDARAV